MEKKAIVLCSGGLDSVTTAHYVKNKLGYTNLIVLFFDYSQHSLTMEEHCSRKCAQDLGAEFKKIRLPELKELSSSLIHKPVEKIEAIDLKDTSRESAKWYVPCRNLFFISYALGLADFLKTEDNGEYTLFLGFKCEGKESYPDATQEFVSKMNEVSKLVTKNKVTIEAPFIEKDKEEIILLGKSLEVDFTNTFSCYNGTDKHCGKCLACLLRKQGFYWANITDPTSYAN